MNLITLENVTKQFSERILLEGVDLRINIGERIGLIGVNGSGKTTLLRIIAGLEPADNGRVTIWGGVKVHFLPQEPFLNDNLTVLEQIFTSKAPQIRLLRDYEWTSHQLQQKPANPTLQTKLAELTDEMTRTGGWNAEADAKAVLSRLGVTDFGAQIGSLSGGERKRVALAQALINPVDLLVLDEPTNHIDAATVGWLETYLTTRAGALLMVTHDRYFLDRVANRIIELNRRQLVSYVGNYGRYLELSAQRESTLAESEWKRERLLQRELAWLRRGAMARSTKQKARKQRVAELQTIHYDRGDERVIFALATRRLGKRVLEAENLSKSFGTTQLFTNINFKLDIGDRIGIVGPNGAGKSTLLDILTGQQMPDSGSIAWGETVHIGYYDQHNRGLIEDMKVIDFINKEAPLIKTTEGDRIEAAQMLEWFLFPRPQQQAKIISLSGGERRRLYLLSILVHQPNVLILDEPTNDLDIQTLTVLESFLDAFKGCLVIVSHDRYFLDRTVDFLAAFDNGRFSSRYPTPYSNFESTIQAQAQNRPLPQPTEQKTKTSSNSTDSRKLTWKEKQELAALEAQIDVLENEKDAMQTAVNQAGNDYQSLTQLAAQLKEVESQLDAVTERWFELSEIAANTV